MMSVMRVSLFLALLSTCACGDPEPAPDGMGRDAVWVGERKKTLDLAEGIVAAVVRFEDDGVEDDKWVVSPDGVLGDEDSQRIRRFFRLYAAVKRVRGKRARFGGIEAP